MAAPTDSDITGTPKDVTFDFGGSEGLVGSLQGRAKRNAGGSVTAVSYLIDYVSTGSSDPTTLSLTDANNVEIKDP